jgi:hypothetical protein
VDFAWPKSKTREEPTHVDHFDSGRAGLADASTDQVQAAGLQPWTSRETGRVIAGHLHVATAPPKDGQH